MRGLNTINWIASHPLSKGKGRRARNIGRFFSWQLRSQLSHKPHVFVFANGAKMLAKSGMTSSTGNLYVGLNEFEEMAFLLHFLRPNNLFADVGANVGSYTILAGAAIGAHVIAFEPDDEARDWLARNVSLNGISDHVEIRREAVGAQIGAVSFTSGLDTVNRIDPTGAVTVPITTLDEVCSRAPTLIKVDVEGYEADVLRGATNILGDHTVQAAIIELNDEAAGQILTRAGFTRCHYDPFERGLTPHEDAALGNGIFVRDVRQADGRVRGAPAFAIHGRMI